MKTAGLARRVGPEAAAVALAIGASLFVAGPALGTGFPLDDAWIHMVYGLALRSTGSLAYDDGHPATGCTSPAWAVLVALAHALVGARGPSMAAVSCVQGVGIGLHAVQSALAAALARAWTPGRRWGVPLGLAAGALVACAPTLAFAAASGMEVPLEGTLLLGALLASTHRRWLAAGALAGLAALARPEGALAVALVPLLALATEGPRAGARTLGVGLAPVGALVVRDLVVSGRPLPATFYVKANPGAQTLVHSIERGVIDVLGHMRPASHGVLWAGVGVALALGGVAVGRCLRRGGRPRTTRRAMVIGATAALALAYAGGISALSFFEKPMAFYYQRYVSPPLVLMVVAGVTAAAWLARAAGRAGVRRTLPLLCVLSLWGVGDEIAAWGAERARFASDVAGTSAQQVAIGRWLNEHLHPGAVVWTIDAGAVRYWGRHPTVDLVRLNTPELFDGPKVKREWWPAAIVLIPEIFETVTTRPLLEVALVVESPSAAPGAREAWRHEVYRCLPDAPQSDDNRVMVFYEKTTLLAVGRCAP